MTWAMRWWFGTLTLGWVAGCSGCGGDRVDRPDATSADASPLGDAGEPGDAEPNGDAGPPRDAAACPPPRIERSPACTGRGTFEGYYSTSVLPLPAYARCSTCSISTSEYIGDLNGDGALDIVYSARVRHVEEDGGVTYQQSFGLVLNEGPTGFSAAVELFPEPGHDVTGHAVADVDADGRAELLQARRRGELAEIRRLDLEDGRLVGPTITSTTRPSEQGFSHLLTGDLDGDGDLDLIARRRWRTPQLVHETWIMENDGTGVFRLRRRLNEPSEFDLAIAPLGGPGASLIRRTNDTVERVRSGGDWFGAPPEVLLTRETPGRYQSVPRILDLDGDGALDIVVAGGGGVDVLLGDGRGGWSRRFIEYRQTGSLFPGDFDGDGRPELLGTVFGSPFGYVLPGLDPTPSPVLYYEFDVHGPDVVDLDGDGRDDLIEAAGAGLGGGIQIFYGGTSAGRSSPYFPGVHSLRVFQGAHVNLAVGDFDGDGNQDAVTGEEGEEIYVAFGEGGGALGPGVPLPVPDPQRGLVARDFDGDCRTDLVLGLRYAGAVDFLPGNGDRTFGAPVRSAVPGEDALYDLRSVDLDRDGVLDLVATGRRLHLLRGLGDGRFERTYASPTMLGSKPGVADLDGDGHLDFVLPAYHTSNGGAYLLFGDGAGGVMEEIFIETEPTAIAAAAGDLDGDGDADLVVGSFSEDIIQVFENQGGRTFSASGVVVPASGPRVLELIDVTGNGHLDLIVSAEGQGRILPGRGDGTFGNAILLGGGTNLDMSVVDFNDDGRMDILRVSPGGGILINYGVCME